MLLYIVVLATTTVLATSYDLLLVLAHKEGKDWSEVSGFCNTGWDERK